MTEPGLFSAALLTFAIPVIHRPSDSRIPVRKDELYRLDQPGRVVGALCSQVPPPGYLVPKLRMALGTQIWEARVGGLLPCSRARKEGEGRARGPGAGQRASSPSPWPRADRNPPLPDTLRGQGRVPETEHGGWGGRVPGDCAPGTAWWARREGDGARTRRRRGANWVGGGASEARVGCVGVSQGWA